MATDSGYSNQKKKGIAQYETIQSLGSSKYGKSVSSKNVFEKTAASPIISVIDVIGSNGQVEFWNVEITAHGAMAGDVLRIVSAALLNFEFDVISVPDADHIKILPISDVKPAAAMSAEILGWVSNKSDASGAAIIASTPIKFLLDSASTEVSKDSITPANTIALPVEDFDARSKLNSILTKMAGSLVPVSYDQVIQTYVGATTDLSTVVFKSSGSTVATLTFSYDGSNRLIDVIRS